MKSIIIFASGKGSNALNIIEHFKSRPEDVHIAYIISNKAEAGVLEHAKNYQIPFKIINTEALNSSAFCDFLSNLNADLIVLAGFLKKIPSSIIQAYPNKIINIHPSLLPKYGGKGMYGHHVHEAVKAANEQETGITIHWVNEQYDKGNHILQAYCPIAAQDSPMDIATKISELEKTYFPICIDFLLQ